MNAYARDLLSAPLRKLRKVEQAVGKKSFDPDATRSGHFKKIEEKKDEFLISRRGRLHRIQPGSSESACTLAVDSKAGYKRVKQVPDGVKSVCAPCFEGRSLAEIRGE